MPAEHSAHSRELANTNLELKVQVETGKQELAEKTALLAEASEALGTALLNWMLLSEAIDM